MACSHGRIGERDERAERGKSRDEWDNDSKPKHTSYLNLSRKPRTHGDHGQAMPTADKASEYRIFESATTEIWKIQNGRLELYKAWNEFPPSFRDWFSRY